MTTPKKPAPRERLPILGPFPCGASRCLCSKGGCDHLGALSEAAKEAIAQSERAPRTGGKP